MSANDCNRYFQAALTPAPCAEIGRDMWAIVFPDGRIVTGSDCETEADAWRIALGWPGPEEIEHAKHNGTFAVKAQLCYSPKNHET